MAGTVQKKIKWSKGQVVPELVERTDLESYDSSAQVMKNVISTVFGGVRSRYGTKYIDAITNLNNAEPTNITSDMFDDTSDFTSNNYKTIEAIGSDRVLALIDYGSNEMGLATFVIKNIRTIPFKLEYKEGGTYTHNFHEGNYRIEIVGGGAGANGGYYYWGGGSGAYAYGEKNLSAGEHTVVVGSKGGYGQNGNPSSFEGEVAGGGYKKGSGVAPGGSGGVATVFEFTGRNGYTGGFGNAIASDAVGGISAYDGTVTGYGAGGSRSGYPTPVEGVDGYASFELLDTTTNIIIDASTNGTEWVTIGEYEISSATRDIEKEINYKYRYIRVSVDTEDPYIVNGLSFQYIREGLSSVGEKTLVRLEPFVYNDTDKYLMVLTNEKIQVYKDDENIAVITATGLSNEYFQTLKTTQKDDTIIFTHEDMYPKILKRTGVDTFVFGDLDLQNIPYTLFGSETTTSKSVGITPSDVEGAIKLTADSSVFDSSWVGQYVDGNGGRMKITEYISGTVVNGYTVIPFYTKDKITSWNYISGYEKVWSVSRGYPRTCLFAQQRLWFGGSKGKPSTVWASRLGDYFNFKNSGNYDNDAIDVDLLTNDVIVNMVDNRGLHIFTTGQEISSKEGTYTPDKISFTTNTRNGSIGTISPVILSGNVLYVEKNGKSLLNYVYDDSQAAYVSDNVSMLSNLVNAPVAMSAEINSSKDRGDLLYVVMADGTMTVGCIVLSQNVKSLSEFKTSGEIKDVCCLRDDVYILVQRNGRACLEKIVSGSLCDSFETRYVTTSTVEGLYRQSGNYVYVWSDTKLYGKYRVVEQQITLDKVPNENVYIGIAYDYEVEGNPIAIAHKTTSIKKRIATADVLCKDTPYLTFCGQKKKGKDEYKFYACTKYDNDVRYNIRGEFYPMQILSLQLNINYEG